MWLAHSAQTFFYQTKIWRMDCNHNCKYHNFVKSIQPQHIQVNPIIYHHRNYIDHDASIKLGDGSRSEEKRPKIWEVGVGQRRRVAMLSVQCKAIDSRFVFSWLPHDVLTGWHWPSLPKPSLSTKDLAGSFCQNLLSSNQDLEDEIQPKLQIQQLCQTNPTRTSSNQSNNILTPHLYGPWHVYKVGDGSGFEEKRPKMQEVRVGQRGRGAMLSVQSKAID